MDPSRDVNPEINAKRLSGNLAAGVLTMAVGLFFLWAWTREVEYLGVIKSLHPTYGGVFLRAYFGAAFFLIGLSWVLKVYGARIDALGVSELGLLGRTQILWDDVRILRIRAYISNEGLPENDHRSHNLHIVSDRDWIVFSCNDFAMRESIIAVIATRAKRAKRTGSMRSWG